MGRTAKKRKAQKKKNGAEEQQGRLSSLPDVIIGYILSLLPTQSAVATSVLYRRWHRLWTHVTSIDVDSYYFEGRRSNFFTVVGKLLRKLTFFRRFRLSICCPRTRTLNISRKRYCSKLDSWIRRLCDRNVHEIEIWKEQLLRPLTQVVTPPCIFQTQSLVVLKLDNQFDFKLPDDDVDINLPNLKILGMALICESHYKLKPKLIRSCPSSEQLYLVPGFNSCIQSPVYIDISAQNLNRLSMKQLGFGKITKVLIDTPKLESLYIKGYTWIRYCFVKNLIGLLEAELDLLGYSESGESTFMLELFEAISSVRSLILYNPELHDMKMFTILTHLRMTLEFPKKFKRVDGFA